MPVACASPTPRVQVLEEARGAEVQQQQRLAEEQEAAGRQRERLRARMQGAQGEERAALHAQLDEVVGRGWAQGAAWGAVLWRGRGQGGAGSKHAPWSPLPPSIRPTT